jgi:FkbM family methyltransferase
MIRGQPPSMPPPATATRGWSMLSFALRHTQLPSFSPKSPKQLLRRLFEKCTGTRIFRTLPRGIDRFADVKSCLPNLDIGVVFDVGANVGQSAKLYLANFRGAKIYCFEPVEATYRQLQNQLCGCPDVLTFKLALGAERGSGTMVLDGSPDMFFLRRAAGEAIEPDGVPLEQVAIETLDGFCERQRVACIGYLKIDTEGADLDVLRGAEAMLRGQRIDIVEAECGMHARNERHVPLGTLTRYLEERNYFLFGIYEQVNEWPIGAPNLRRTNPVFISDRVIRANIAS